MRSSGWACWPFSGKSVDLVELFLVSRDFVDVYLDDDFVAFPRYDLIDILVSIKCGQMGVHFLLARGVSYFWK